MLQRYDAEPDEPVGRAGDVGGDGGGDGGGRAMTMRRYEVELLVKCDPDVVSPYDVGRALYEASGSLPMVGSGHVRVLGHRNHQEAALRRYVFDVRDRAYITLTPKGRDALLRVAREWLGGMERVSLEEAKPYLDQVYPRWDKDGEQVKMPIWLVMMTFGSEMGMGADQLFEAEFQIETMRPQP